MEYLAIGVGIITFLLFVAIGFLRPREQDHRREER
jgi:hypothetical protein